MENVREVIQWHCERPGVQPIDLFADLLLILQGHHLTATVIALRQHTRAVVQSESCRHFPCVLICGPLQGLCTTLQIQAPSPSAPDCISFGQKLQGTREASIMSRVCNPALIAVFLLIATALAPAAPAS